MRKESNDENVECHEDSICGEPNLNENKSRRGRLLLFLFHWILYLTMLGSCQNAEFQYKLLSKLHCINLGFIRFSIRLVRYKKFNKMFQCLFNLLFI